VTREAPSCVSANSDDASANPDAARGYWTCVLTVALQATRTESSLDAPPPSCHAAVTTHGGDLLDERVYLSRTQSKQAPFAAKRRIVNLPSAEYLT